jgi:hypothetical protein
LLLQAEGWLSPFAALSPRNAASVRWAVREILTSTGQVRPDWRSAFLRLGATAGYRSIQVESAIKIHEKALDYFVDWKFKDLRSYLFLVDIVVQNGGFYSVNRSELASFLQARPGATESEQLKFLLERRLRFVRSEYVADVRARKITIIDGRGRVHGRNRNLPLEYCFSHTERL